MEARCPAGRWLAAACLGLILVAALVSYAPTVRGGFVSWDDPEFLFSPEGPKNFVEALTRPFPNRAFYPVFRVSLCLDLRLWGTRMAPRHATNVGLHAANALLVLLLLHRMFRDASDEAHALLAAWAAAMLFAVHPVNTEAVAWLSGRKILLATFFGLASAYAYVHSSTEARGARLWRTTAPVLFAAACLSNAIIVALPAGLLAWTLLVHRESRVGVPTVFRQMLRMADLFLIALLAGILRLPGMLTPGNPPLLTRDEISTATLPMVLRGTFREVVSVFMPVHLTHLYRRFPTAWWHSEVIGCLALFGLSAVVVLVALGASGRAKRRIALGAFSAAWFWLLLAPKLAHHIPRADRHLYVAGIGIFALLGVALARTGMRREGASRFAMACPLAVCMLLVPMTWRQARVWRHSVSLWSQTTRVFPDWALAHGELASGLATVANRPYAARMEYLRSVTLNPDDAQSWYNLGGLMDRAESLEPALTAYREAVRAEPEFAAAYNNMGSILLRLGRTDEALSALRCAIELNPSLPLPHYNMAKIFLAGGQNAALLDQARAAMRCEPWNAVLRAELARMLRKAGLEEEAGAMVAEGIALARDTGDLRALELLEGSPRWNAEPRATP